VKNIPNDMISKAKSKWIKSLGQRKKRAEEKVFVAEGPKLVGELMSVMRPVYVCALPQWIHDNKRHLAGRTQCDEINEEELERTSLLRTPQNVIAVFPTVEKPIPEGLAKRELCLALDGVQDPGNMGTILRIADWFGIGHVICSHDTADIYNPKAVQATMGALARVKVHYTDLRDFVSQCGAPVYGTFLNGKNLYTEELSATGVIVMGNEGNGISESIGQLVSRRLYVPNYPMGGNTTESLNVAVATGIVCAEFRRREQQA